MEQKILAQLLETDSDELIRCAVGSFGTLAMDKEICEELREIGGYQGVVKSFNFRR